MFVRWIGAFRKMSKESVYSCIKFEMHRQTVFACEKIRKGDKSNIFARVGLAVRPENIYRNFKSDVWSVYDKEGKLKTTRSGSGSAWKESWASPENAFDAIVISCGWWTLRPSVRNDIMMASAEFGLKVLQLSSDGKIKDITQQVHYSIA